MLFALLLILADLAAQSGFYTASQPDIAAAIDLESDGKFAYSLDHGALYEIAEGSWTSEGSTIYLTSARLPVAYRQAVFAREPLVIEGGALVLRRHNLTIRFNRDDGLPTPPNRNTKL